MWRKNLSEGDDDDIKWKGSTAVILFGSLSAFSALIAAYQGSQALPLSTACRAGDAAQCEKYASTVRHLQAFGAAAAVFGLLTYVAWRLWRRAR